MGETVGERPEQPGDENAAIWQSEEMLQAWRALADERLRRREHHFRLLAGLLPFGRDKNFSFLELGAGAGGATRVLLDTYTAATAVLADFSPQMMAEGERELADYAGRFSYVVFDMATSDWPVELGGPFDAAVTSLCIHHLTDARKAAIFAGIFERLVPGGWYFNYDPVRAPDPVVGARWQATNDRDDPEAAHKRHNRSAEEQARFENHVRHLAPLTPQLAALADAGFEGVDVYWRYLEDAIFGGRRPE